MFKKYIGTAEFYKRVLVLMIPIMVQNGITNFVNMLDNIMVGSVGTVEMTGVAVSNQLIFVFNLCVFGAVSGAGIFGAQFFGNNDTEGLRHTFRFKVLFCTLLSVLVATAFIINGDFFIGLYLKGEGDAADIAASTVCARDYLRIMLIGFIPYTLTQCYSSTLRETGHAVLPMVSGMIAVSVNLFFNYVLIFGHFGAPALGVDGAAIATVISRFVELIIIALVTRIKSSEHQFIVGAYKSFYVPFSLIKDIFKKGVPLMINETAWAAGIAMLNQRYSLLGYDVVSANNICQTFSNVFSVAFMAVGATIGIIIGQYLGAGNVEKAKEESVKLMAFSVFVGLIVSALYFVLAGFIPDLYNTTDSVKNTANVLMKIYAAFMVFDAYANACYFTLRSGGKVIITMLFDSIFLWCAPVFVAIILTKFTAITIFPLFAICQLLHGLKCILGHIFYKKGIWIKQIV